MTTEGAGLVKQFLDNLGEPRRGWSGAPALHKAVFAAGLLIAVCVQLTVLIIPMARRTAPVEPDDAYVHILKAAEMEACFRQDCPALLELRRQLEAPTADPEVSWIRYREFTRLFVFYQPLHSTLLLGLHSLGMALESAYNLMSILGAALLVAGAAVWILLIWGPAPAGLASIFLAFNIWRGHAPHVFVPSDMALCLAVWTWAAIARWGAGARWLVFPGVVLMTAMHPMGRIYAAATLAGWWLLLERGERRKILPAACLGALAIGAAFALPLVVTRPVLGFHGDPPPAGWTRWQGLADNAGRSAYIIWNWSLFYGGPLVLAFLAAAMQKASPRQRRAMAGLGGALVLFAGASQVYMLPRYPAETFRRVWLALAIVLAGGLGAGIWIWLESLPRHLRSFRGRSGFLGLMAATTLAACIFMITGAVKGARSLSRRISTNLDRQDLLLDAGQVRTLLEGEKAAGPILYMDEVPMHFYFCRGALQLGAIFYPALEGSEAEKARFIESSGCTRLVALNPLCELDGSSRGGLRLEPGKPTELRIAMAAPADAPALFLGNEGARTAMLKCSLEPEGGPPAGEADPPIELAIPPGASSWVPLPLPPGRAFRGMTLTAARKNALSLQGFRLDPRSGLRWPWDRGLTVNRAGAVIEPVSLQAASLFKGTGAKVHVIDDAGSTVLARIESAR